MATFQIVVKTSAGVSIPTILAALSGRRNNWRLNRVAPSLPRVRFPAGMANNPRCCRDSIRDRDRFDP